jgi:hypothetical protein
VLAFIDESGDTGLKVAQGSSEYFVVALVTFEDHDEAIACDQRIELLKREVGMSATDEFKFGKLPGKKREAFFEAVGPYAFFYFGIAIRKAKLWGKDFQFKESFYKYACRLVFENAKPHLRDAIVVIDGSGSREFKRQLGYYLRRHAGSGVIRKLKVQSSHNNNLIQLADMVVGAINRSLTEKDDRAVYRKQISAKEMSVQVWPK